MLYVTTPWSLFLQCVHTSICGFMQNQWKLMTFFSNVFKKKSYNEFTLSVKNVHATYFLCGGLVLSIFFRRIYKDLESSDINNNFSEINQTFRFELFKFVSLIDRCLCLILSYTVLKTKRRPISSVHLKCQVFQTLKWNEHFKLMCKGRVMVRTSHYQCFEIFSQFLFTSMQYIFCEKSEMEWLSTVVS